MQGNDDREIAHLQGPWIITTTDERVTVSDMAVTGVNGTILLSVSEDGSVYAEYMKLIEYKNAWIRWKDTRSNQSFYLPA